MATPDWAAQYEDDPALRESPAEAESCGNRVWRRDGLLVTRGATRKFAEAHSSLRHAAVQFYTLNSFVLALPSALELLFAVRNFVTDCGCGIAVWMTVDSCSCLAGCCFSIWLCRRVEVLTDLDIHEYLLRTARGDCVKSDDLEKRVHHFQEVGQFAATCAGTSVLTSVVLWIIGLFLFFFKDLSRCREVRFWLRFVMWVRVVMPFFVICCVVPIQQLCCQAGCFSRISALKGLAEAQDAQASEEQTSSCSESSAGTETNCV
mmetsp:Transcript_28712/g.66571  ORF Transcript_28712/g.66571 Transcript_28712/m.66571 type:complete len:262 (-) Transcript_28712:32-817(-)